LTVRLHFKFLNVRAFAQKIWLKIKPDQPGFFSVFFSSINKHQQIRKNVKNLGGIDGIE
jgi:hypothetical protein